MSKREETSNNRFNRIALLSRPFLVASLGKGRANDALPVKRMLQRPSGAVL